MSEDNVSEFPGRKPKPTKELAAEFDSFANRQAFSQTLANLINDSRNKVSIPSVIGSLETLKADILFNQMIAMRKQVEETPLDGEKH